MSGFQTELVTRILGVNGHITVEAFAGQKIDNYQPVLSSIRAFPACLRAAGAGWPGAADHRARRRPRRPGARHHPDDLRALHPVSDHIVAGSAG